jgi:uncharacterized phage-associated protein
MVSLNQRFSFNEDKAIETIVYVAKKAPNPDVYHLAKVCYFADLLHMERFGRPIFGDVYIKMENGPVPSKIYNLFKAVRDFSHHKLVSEFAVEGNMIKALRDYDEDEFSPSDLMCLNESIEIHGTKTFKQLKDESHDSAWESAQDNREIEYREMIKTLPNGEDLIKHLSYC